MKKLFLILLAALCALLPAFTALADGTTLKTEVPYTHNITISCGEHGCVSIDGKVYTGTFTVEVKRLGTLIIMAMPDLGYGLSQVIADDLDGMHISGSVITLESIHCDNVLEISFYRKQVIWPSKPPIVTPTPTATPTVTATPTPPPTVEPTVTATPTPTSTVEPTVTATPTPTVEPTVTATPTPKPPTLADTVVLPEIEMTENILYDDYVGTGGGLWQTSIVFDGDYEPEDYELLDVFIDDELQGNSVLVCAFPDEEGNVDRRSLILSADQLVKLAQKQESEHIIFENGAAIAEMDMVDILGGDMQKLMALILSGNEEITPETLERDWSLVESVVIPAAQLRKIDVETRIVPVEQADGSIVYEVSVWLRWDDQELDVSGMIPSLTVAIAVDDLVTEENFETFTTLYTLAHQAPNENETDDELPDITMLPSSLLLMPDELPEHQDDTAEHFLVTVSDEENEHPVTAYDANAHLVPYRHYALAADYAGEGIYWVQEVE